MDDEPMKIYLPRPWKKDEVGMQEPRHSAGPQINVYYSRATPWRGGDSRHEPPRLYADVQRIGWLEETK